MPDISEMSLQERVVDAMKTYSALKASIVEEAKGPDDCRPIIEYHEEDGLNVVLIAGAGEHVSMPIVVRQTVATVATQFDGPPIALLLCIESYIRSNISPEDAEQARHGDLAQRHALGDPNVSEALRVMGASKTETIDLVRRYRYVDRALVLDEPLPWKADSESLRALAVSMEVLA